MNTIFIKGVPTDVTKEGADEIMRLRGLLDKRNAKILELRKSPKLIVKNQEYGYVDMLEACIEGAPGSPVVGLGNTVCEAVGNWAIYSGDVQVICDPPELLDKFIASDGCVTDFKPAPERT